MAIAETERIPLGILTRNEAKFAAAFHGIDTELFEIVQITDDYPEIPAASSIEVATFSARQAARDHGIAVIREDHSMHFDGLEGLPGPYAKHAEAHLGIRGLLRILEGLCRTGSYVTSAALSDEFGMTIGTTSRIDFTVAEEPRGTLQPGWPQLISIDAVRTLAEYPESERICEWSSNYCRLSQFLGWRQNRVIYLTGPHAAGKTEAATILQDEHGYGFFDLGPAMRKAHQDSGSTASLTEWVSDQEAIHGPSFTDDLLAVSAHIARADSPHPRGFAIVGSRSIGGLTHIDKYFEPSARLHLHLDATESLLYDRYCAREQHKITKQEFKHKLVTDQDMGLKEFGDVADVVIRNDGDKGTLFTAINNAISAWELRLPSDDLFYID